MGEGWLIVGLGAFEVFASFFTSGISVDKAFHANEFRPPSQTWRIVIFCLGVLTIAFGVARLMRWA